MSRQSSPAFSLKVGPHGPDGLGVSGVSGSEGLSRLYDFRVDFFTVDAEPLEVAELVGQDALVTFSVRDFAARHVHGWVREVEALGMKTGRRRYRAHVVPRLWRLTQAHKSRIFQEKTVPDILKAVLKENGIEVRAALSAAYAPREYCVQYRETDFAFLSRLMEWEGIFYFFEHAEDGHTLVLGDKPSAHAPLPQGKALPLRPSLGKAVVEEEYLSALEVVHRLRPGAVHLKDYDFEKPALDVSGKTEAAEGVTALELYDYPAGYVTPGVGKSTSSVRVEEATVGGRTLAGDSVAPRLTPGFLLEVELSEEDVFAGEYLVTDVVHSGLQPDVSGGSESLQGLYRNQFQLLPKAVPFRPRRKTPPPRIAGLQTATVVGPSGEEIHTDAHGRVKVQFHWDREGKRDEKASCWVRVGQPWGGPAWGDVWLPRIGQEVVVRFLEGDPDRPLVAGAVYNGSNMAPYPLPDEKTKSTRKSASSPGSDGFNEVRVEDSTGAEEIFTHAQKDEDLLTENNKDQQVGGYESLLVKKDRKRTVEGFQSLLVKKHDVAVVEGNQSLLVEKDRESTTLGSHDEAVDGNQVMSVGGNLFVDVSKASSEMVGAAKATTIGGALAVSVALALNEATGGVKSLQVGGAHFENVIGHRSETVAEKTERKVGTDWKTEVKGGATVTVGRDLKEEVKGLFQIAVKEETTLMAKTYSLKSDKLSVIVNGNLALQVEKSGNVKLYAKTLTLDGSEVKFKGAKVKMEAAGSAKSESISLKEIGKLPPAESGSMKIKMKSRSGGSVEGREFELKLPDGSVRKGTLDGQGGAKLDKLPEGESVLSFPKPQG
ncbi:type VI secretion system tip protein VgrG [Myxococcus sp. CA039A]|uniref:type VI secretion system Vgr family protein n=1 Tax=Myxococcus sp. CA039A TaxID=2741737 RepID=UPI00157A3B5F|nr:type VI secretion system tip protein TssI/VgrG [Myxococcus sp. CA039A]NTX52484.1 type VI secretion system tip protein VgrG [Myxococcus sp. CA039A]